MKEENETLTSLIFMVINLSRCALVCYPGTKQPRPRWVLVILKRTKMKLSDYLSSNEFYTIFDNWAMSVAYEDDLSGNIISFFTVMLHNAAKRHGIYFEDLYK